MRSFFFKYGTIYQINGNNTYRAIINTVFSLCIHIITQQLTPLYSIFYFGTIAYQFNKLNNVQLSKLPCMLLIRYFDLDILIP